jgi:hypothetical protein
VWVPDQSSPNVFERHVDAIAANRSNREKVFDPHVIETLHSDGTCLPRKMSSTDYWLRGEIECTE